MRLLGLLDLSRSALTATQVGIRTAGHNIANVNTPGFSRQRVEYVSAEPLPAPRGFQLGGGVRAGSLRGVRDPFIEAQLVVEDAGLGDVEARSRPLERIDALMNELGGEGIHTALDRLFNSMRDVAAHPESLSHRSSVRAEAQILTERVRATAQAVQAVREGLDIDVLDHVNEVNRLATDVASLNDRIAAAEASGQEASDLRDRRQASLRELAGHIDIRVFEDDAGRTVVVGPRGKPLVEGITAAKLVTERDASNRLLVEYESPTGRRTDITDAIAGGGLRGVITARDVNLVELGDRLDEFAYVFANEINAIHRVGFGLDGIDNREFFAPPPQQQGAALAMAVSDDVLSDVKAIAAATELDALPGDNRNALALSDLQDVDLFPTGVAPPSMTAGEYISRTVRDVGAWTRDNQFQIDFQTLKVGQLNNLRESTSGVSLDEEMLDLTKLQAAFSASAKVIQAVDEMLGVVLSLGQ